MIVFIYVTQTDVLKIKFSKMVLLYYSYCNPSLSIITRKSSLFSEQIGVSEYIRNFVPCPLLLPRSHL